MGKGDKKSRRGKISMGSYGKTRKRKTGPGIAAITEAKEAKEKAAPKPKAKAETAEAPAEKKKAAPKKAAAKKAEE